MSFSNIPPCPICGSESVHRSRRTGFAEWCIALLGGTWRRCHTCQFRYALLWSRIVHATGARQIARRITLLALMAAGAFLFVTLMAFFMNHQS